MREQVIVLNSRIPAQAVTEKRDYAVAVANSGAEALAALEQVSFDAHLVSA
jgi:CheY-like chemotaxis protein